MDFAWIDVYNLAIPGVPFGAANRHPSVMPFNDAAANNTNVITADTRSLPLEWLWARALAEWT